MAPTDPEGMVNCRPTEDGHDLQALAEGCCPNCRKPLVVEDGWGHCRDNPRTGYRLRNGRLEFRSHPERGRYWRYPEDRE